MCYFSALAFVPSRAMTVLSLEGRLLWSLRAVLASPVRGGQASCDSGGPAEPKRRASTWQGPGTRSSLRLGCPLLLVSTFLSPSQGLPRSEAGEPPVCWPWRERREGARVAGLWRPFAPLLPHCALYTTSPSLGDGSPTGNLQSEGVEGARAVADAREAPGDTCQRAGAGRGLRLLGQNLAKNEQQKCVLAGVWRWRWEVGVQVS